MLECLLTMLDAVWCALHNLFHSILRKFMRIDLFMTFRFLTFELTERLTQIWWKSQDCNWGVWNHYSPSGLHWVVFTIDQISCKGKYLFHFKGRETKAILLRPDNLLVLPYRLLIRAISITSALVVKSSCGDLIEQKIIFIFSSYSTW